MAFEDRYVTLTPEGVSLEASLAGLGSRFTAYLIDFAIQVAAFYLFALILVATTGSHPSTTTDYTVIGLESAFAFVDFFGYFVISEMVSSGRSLGKRAAGIRVVLSDGSPISFKASVLRNIVRLVDSIPPPLCLVGSVLILAMRKNQRLGDLLADTIVIRERTGANQALRGVGWGDLSQWSSAAGYAAGGAATVAGPPPAAGWAGYAAGGGAPAGYGYGYGYGPGYGSGSGHGYGFGFGGGGWAPPPEAAHWDVSAVTLQDVAVVQAYLQNRYGYSPDARIRLSHDLATRLAPLVHGPTGPMDPDRFLELVVAVKAARG